MWYVMYFGSIGSMLMSIWVSFIAIQNAVHGYGMNWIAFIVGIIVAFVSAYIHALFEE